MRATTSTASAVDPDLQMLIDQAPPLDHDQRHGLRELLRPADHTAARTAFLMPRGRSAPKAEAA